MTKVFDSVDSNRFSDAMLIDISCISLANKAAAFFRDTCNPEDIFTTEQLTAWSIKQLNRAADELPEE